MSRPALPRSDRAVWQRAIHDVTPLPGRNAPLPVGPSQPPAPARAEPYQASPPEAGAVDRFAGIDRANAERLKRGLHEIEARLDLHGMTQAAAHRALAAFIGL